ncbi:hypothetical protein AC578_10029 [Pseudocercospora eumusae]|uniref:Uncharacterized protein n=1 Tax=Pseudocercospora eumusae TaxID=321146 RepID=A0A139H6I8_9PEZI|nr:hypothetical protein AC578_10029 [Pseudocercospora eumusae]
MPPTTRSQRKPNPPPTSSSPSSSALPNDETINIQAPPIATTEQETARYQQITTHIDRIGSEVQTLIRQGLSALEAPAEIRTYDASSSSQAEDEVAVAARINLAKQQELDQERTLLDQERRHLQKERAGLVREGEMLARERARLFEMRRRMMELGVPEGEEKEKEKEKEKTKEKWGNEREARR